MPVFISFILSVIITFAVLALALKIGLGTLFQSIFGGKSFLINLIVLIVAFVSVFKFVNSKLAPPEIENAYITTKVELAKYEKIEKEPFGKESGNIAVDTVVKVIHSKEKNSLTWLEGYVLSGDSAEKIFLLVPEIVSLTESNKYFSYNQTSKSFSAYYKRIDTENSNLQKTVSAEFLKELELYSINVKGSTDNVLRESIKKTHFVLDPEGYFDNFVVKNNEFYYITNDEKSAFKKIVSQKNYELLENTKKYFN